MNKMVKSVFAAATCAALALGVTACSGTSNGSSGGQQSSSAAEQKAPADLTGTWTMTEPAPSSSASSSNKAWFEVGIEGETIVVEMVYDGGDSRALYWQGTYEAPTELGDYTWDSQNDKGATAMALLGSKSDTKTFTYDDKAGTLSFDFTAQGTTQTIKCEKTSDEPTSSVQKADAAAQKTRQKFDGSAFSDTGAGTMYVMTGSNNTSENGNVPELAVSANTSAKQISLCTRDMDGSVCTVYVDGVYNTEINANSRLDTVITLSGDALKEGVHKVELVKMDGDTPAIYKSAEYKAV